MKTQIQESQIEDEASEADGDDYEPPEPKKESVITIVVVAPDAPPVEMQIPNELSALQSVVGGLIEVFPIGIEGAVGVCNEEGHLRGLPMCRLVAAAGAIIVGTFFIAGDGINFRSLSPRQIREAMRIF